MTVFFGINSYTAWQNYSADPKKYQDQQRDDVSTKLSIDYFKENAPKIETLDDLFKDRRLMQVILGAYSLGDAIDKMGIIKKAFTENPADEDALVTKLAERKYEEMAKDLKFYEEDGLDKLKDTDFLNGIIDKFVQNETEIAMGEQDPNLREAAYFARNIDTVDNIYNLLGDKILRSVMQTYLDLPDQFAIQSVETQAQYILNRIDLEDFKADISKAELSDTELTEAKEDIETLTSAQNVADAAQTQVDIMLENLQLAYDGYSELATVTDPAGPYASEIPVQEAAVPELVQYQSINQAATEALDGMGSFFSTLDQLIEDAGNPANSANLASYKTQFSTTVTAINSFISNATYYDPITGTEQNALLNGSDSTLSTQVTSAGETIDYQVFDLSDLQTALSDAETAFNNVTGSGDSVNLQEAYFKASTAKFRHESVTDSMTANTEELATIGDKVEVFASTLNTQELSQGKRSIDDSLNRITKIEGYLDEINRIADESRQLVSTADRSELQTEFETYRDLIRQEIENTGSAGLDNFLNNLASQTYNVIGTSQLQVTGGYDLATQISDVLDAGGVSTQADAEAMYTTSVTSTSYTDAARNTLEPEQVVFDETLSYDALGNVQNLIYSVHDSLSTFIADAAEGGNNLLASDQEDIDYSVNSSLTPITLNAYSSFETDFDALLDGVISAMAISTADAQSALDSALSYLSDVDRGIGSDSRQINFEYGKSAVIVDTLEADNVEEEENPYETNQFTTKFLERFLILNGSDNLFAGGAGSGDNYVLDLFGNVGTGQTGDTSQYFTNIFNLLV